MIDWQQTHEISMAIQTAEMRLSHASMAETFFATCNLINIARGQSIVTIVPVPDDAITNCPLAVSTIGQINIKLNKRHMDINAVLPRVAFDRLIRHIRQASPRPAVLKVDINEALAVSVDGDLSIDKEMTLDITDITVTIPIR
ncbi:MAG: hypothetical protein P8N97_01060 [Alphaproteobacteria bacterium]|nr:hypothetical protein [Alphaproteobacteria bacterium]